MAHNLDKVFILLNDSLLKNFILSHIREMFLSGIVVSFNNLSLSTKIHRLCVHSLRSDVKEYYEIFHLHT